MIQTRARAALVGAAIILAAALGASGQAQAAVYRGVWDPAFGASSVFPSLGWKGTATFSIPDACLADSGWIAFDNACANNGGMKVLGATVGFYDAINDRSGTNILETLAFSNPMWLVYSMEITDHKLTGVSAGFSESVRAYYSLAGSGTNYFALTFFPGDGSGTGKGASLFYTRAGQNPTCAYPGPSSSANCGYSTTTPNVTYALVPEPATVALVLAGLAAIGLVARRRRR